ncbi:hypothetical protein C8Q76DRAFT_801360 [Earliella scabrosa]|nr:hypothetical protein C8Q76DRAFT_801360 [Earliella scabrosa]
MSAARSSQDTSESQNQVELPAYPQECLACRVIGTGAFGGVGIYALYQSRAQAPGSAVGKRFMAGLGVCFLVASALRWSK